MCECKSSSPKKSNKLSKTISKVNKKLTKIGRNPAVKQLARAVDASLGATTGVEPVKTLREVKKLAKMVKSLSGRGAYEMRAEGQANSIVNTGMLSDVPIPTGGVMGDNVYSNREYIMDIYSPGAGFHNTAYSINPGLSNLFPLLKQFLQNYEMYEFEELMFTFRTSVSSATYSGAMGLWIMAVNYNALSEAFTNKRSMEDYDGAIAGRICDMGYIGAECGKGRGPYNRLFVRTGPIGALDDLKTYDFGKFNFATNLDGTTFPQGTVLGELWVTYRVRAYKMKLYSYGGSDILIDRWITNYSAPTGTDILPMGNNALKCTQGNFGCALARTSVVGEMLDEYGALSAITGQPLVLPDTFVGRIKVCLTFWFYAPTTDGSALLPNMAVGTGASITPIYYSSWGGIPSGATTASWNFTNLINFSNKYDNVAWTNYNPSYNTRAATAEFCFDVNTPNSTGGNYLLLVASRTGTYSNYLFGAVEVSEISPALSQFSTSYYKPY